jgi:hypothetical protein
MTTGTETVTVTGTETGLEKEIKAVAQKRFDIFKSGSDQLYNLSGYWDMMREQYEGLHTEEGTEMTDENWAEYVKNNEKDMDEWWLMQFIDEVTTEQEKEAAYEAAYDKAMTELQACIKEA